MKVNVLSPLCKERDMGMLGEERLEILFLYQYFYVINIELYWINLTASFPDENNSRLTRQHRGNGWCEGFGIVL